MWWYVAFDGEIVFKKKDLLHLVFLLIVILPFIIVNFKNAKCTNSQNTITHIKTINIIILRLPHDLNTPSYLSATNAGGLATATSSFLMPPPILSWFGPGEKSKARK